MKRLHLILLALALAFVMCGPSHQADAQSVNGWNLGSLGAPPVNLICIGDSIPSDYLGTNPPTQGITYTSPLSASQTGFCSVAAYSLQQQGHYVRFTDLAIPFTSTWQWRSHSGSFVIPTSLAGYANLAVLEFGTNDMYVASSASGGTGWTPNFTYTGVAYVIASVSGTPTIFHTVAGGTSGGTTPAWAASGNITDGSITWVAISLSQLLTDIEANELANTNYVAGLGYSVIASPILPFCEATTAPQTLANGWSQVQSWATWIVGENGTNGIKTVQRWDQNATMWVPGYPTACSNTTYYHTDGVHPTDAGHALLAVETETALTYALTH
jgi:hypothetical protein